MRSDEWKETAILITRDDSDGWYDHQMGPIVRQSNTTDDALLGPNNCGSPKSNDISGGTQNGRCGFGPRIPLLVISPFAKTNYVDHRLLDFSSITRFIEDNFKLGRIGNGSADEVAGTLDGLFDFDNPPRAPKLILDPSTGQVVDKVNVRDHDGKQSVPSVEGGSFRGPRSEPWLFVHWPAICCARSAA